LAVRDARAAGGTAVVLTFDPHPSRVLSPDRAPASLMTLGQKAEVLSGLGVDRLAGLPFTVELSRQDAGAFARSVLHCALGRRVGIPTANLELLNETVPGGGVYACWCRVLGDASAARAAAVNVGRRPTFGGGEMTVEAHLLEYEGDLYGRTLRVEFEQRLRE